FFSSGRRHTSFSRDWSSDVCSSDLKWLFTTFGLGIIFIVLQFNGFSQMIGQGYYFTGPTSSIKMSYVFLIAAVHIVHVVAGLTRSEERRVGRGCGSRWAPGPATSRR